MIKIKKNNFRTCPHCQSSALSRMHRDSWMRKYPGSRQYSCQKCGLEYLSFFKYFYIKTRVF